ncbi:MAG: peptidase U32 family protein [Bacteroidales bacterium]|nr:peptidase U32 family protein [Bacteroidales bacterium]
MTERYKIPIEIMAPVGSYESLTAAIQGGADSVYFGVGRLNMRSRSSQNFSMEDLKEIVRICEENHVKSYVTLNTIVYDDELEEMRSIVDAVRGNSVTAIIASDMSVINYALEQGVEVHLSTQTNITNIEAVRYYARFADVIVTARELSLDQVSVITQKIKEERITGPSGALLRIEVFAHGALCMAISGKCYLSLDNENHSGNRGACYQLCRRPYKVTDLDGKNELVIDNEYIMSPKDLCTIEFLDKIVDSGVQVLKIEGRGRSADYVKTVTRCYKEASIALSDGTYTQERINHWLSSLRKVYNRGFWSGYYLGKKMGEWTKKYGNLATHKKIYVGKITNYFTRLKIAEVKLETMALSVGDEIRIIGPTTGVYEGVAEEIRVDYETVSQAEKGVTCSIPVDTFLRRSDKLYKVVPSDSVTDDGQQW